MRSIGLDRAVRIGNRRYLDLVAGRRGNGIGIVNYHIKRQRGYCKIGKLKFLIKAQGQKVSMYFRECRFDMEQINEHRFILKYNRNKQLIFEMEKWVLDWFPKSKVFDFNGNEYNIPISCHGTLFDTFLFFLRFLTLGLFRERLYPIVPSDWESDDSSIKALIAGVILLHIVYKPHEYCESM